MKVLSERTRHNLRVLYQVTKANFTLQNESSVFGILWYLMGPILLFGILVFVFSQRLGAHIEQYPLYVLLGVVSWNFFSASTMHSMRSLVVNAAILKSLPIRADIFVFTSVLHALTTHVLEIIIFIGIVLFFHVSLTPLVLLYIPVLVISVTFCTGVSFALSICYVYLRDSDQIWSVLTRAWWFATPIFYSMTTTGPGSKVSLFNPMFYIIDLSRSLLIYGEMPALHLWVNAALFSVISLLLGYGVFNKYRFHIIDKL